MSADRCVPLVTVADMQAEKLSVPADSGQSADLDDLADLDALADALNQLGFPSLRLTPPGKLPYVDTGLPKLMTPGERIYTAAGTFCWHTAQPIAPSDRPATAAAIIARTLTPTTPASRGDRHVPEEPHRCRTR